MTVPYSILAQAVSCTGTTCSASRSPSLSTWSAWTSRRRSVKASRVSDGYHPCSYGLLSDDRCGRVVCQLGDRHAVLQPRFSRATYRLDHHRLRHRGDHQAGDPVAQRHCPADRWANPDDCLVGDSRHHGGLFYLRTV